LPQFKIGKVKKSLQVILLIALIILADQVLKIYIKTHFYAGKEVMVFGNWFRLHFVENPGMAWGWKFGGEWGKIALTLFRLVAVIWGTFLIRGFIRKKEHPGFIICSALIYAGALGNLIDSMFYGLIFNYSNPLTENLAQFVPFGTGYGKFLQGYVVDMLYFPLCSGTWPSWLPFLGGGSYQFFQPVFNIADASISIGVILMLVFQKKFFPKQKEEPISTVETSTPVTDENQVL
jgi:signal peptidase II